MPFFAALVRRAAALLLLVAATAAPAFADLVDGDALSGRWMTFDDRTHEASGIVRIYEQNGRWFGRIEGRDGDRAVCDACRDERHGQPMRGLLIIRDLRRVPGDPHGWDGGDVLDPRSGHLYRIKMHLDDDGEHLVIHGYIGLSLIGRSQTWGRAG